MLSSERQVRLDFSGFLHKLDYTNPPEVFMASRYISDWLCHGRPGPGQFEMVADVLGRRLEMSGGYTKEQIDEAVYHMLKYRKM